jgi:hypothetical protein
MPTHSIDAMSDRELLNRLGQIAGDARIMTADLLALLGEVDARRLFLGEGCSSLFTYCTQVLHLSEHSAYHRIEAARVARRFPGILGLIADGSLTLTTVAMLRPHLTVENSAALLAAACHKSKREVEHQIACFAPRPDAKALLRRLPTDRTPVPQLRDSAPEATQSLFMSSPSIPTAPARTDPRSKIAPSSADRYLLRVTLTAEAHANLRRAQALMRHSVPGGDPADILGRALTLLVEQLEKTKCAKVSRPHAVSGARPNVVDVSRHIPAAVRRAVWSRDKGQCAFVGWHGRCLEKDWLELHHRVPFACGGPATVENLALHCRAHNGYEREAAFGPLLRPDESAGTRSGPR